MSMQEGVPDWRDHLAEYGGERGSMVLVTETQARARVPDVRGLRPTS